MAFNDFSIARILVLLIMIIIMNFGNDTRRLYRMTNKGLKL
jgi:hypothetical protein